MGTSETGPDSAHNPVGRPTVVSPDVGALLVLLAISDPNASPKALRRHLLGRVAEGELPAAAIPSHRTIRRFMRPHYERSLCRRRPGLTMDHKLQRAAWAPRMVLAETRRRVIFTDEMYLKANTVGQRQYKWVPKWRQAEAPPTVDANPRGWALMIWGGLALDTGATELYICPYAADKSHIVDAEHYQRILESHAIPFMLQNPDCIFQQDNAPGHTDAQGDIFWHAMDFKHRRHFQRLLEWPPKSPDLSPVEYAWAVLRSLCDQHLPSDCDVPTAIPIIRMCWRLATTPRMLEIYDARQVRSLLTTIEDKGDNARSCMTR